MLIKNINYNLFFLFFFPISLIIGSAAVNLLLIIASLIVIYNTIEQKYNIFKLYWVRIFFFFILFLSLISFFSDNSFSAFKASLSQTRFILFSFFIYFIDLKKNFNLFKNFLTILLVIVCIDINIQFVFGYDIFGYPAEGYLNNDYDIFSHWKNDAVNVGRLSGPFGYELIPGAFIASLSTPLIFYHFKSYKDLNYKKNLLNFLIIFLFIESTLITGERLSSLLILSCFFASLLISFGLKKSFFISTIIVTSIYLISILSLSQTNFLKKRWIEGFNISINIKDSSYGRIYSSSYEVWSKNKLKGTGLKNYRIECPKLEDPKPESPHPYCSPTHSHNLYLELLSETGILGFIIFFSFYLSLLFYLFKNSLKKINDVSLYFGFGSLFYLIFKLLPLPAGSVFSTWNASILWFHIGISLCFLCNKQKIINK